MGRMKDLLHDIQGNDDSTDDNKSSKIDWVQMKQNEVVRCHTGTVALMYNDLIDLDEIEDDDTEVLLQLVDDIQLKFKAGQIVKVNGVCLTYKREYDSYDGTTLHYTIHVPMDKIIYSRITTISGKDD